MDKNGISDVKDRGYMKKIELTLERDITLADMDILKSIIKEHYLNPDCGISEAWPCKFKGKKKQSETIEYYIIPYADDQELAIFKGRIFPRSNKIEMIYCDDFLKEYTLDEMFESFSLLDLKIKKSFGCIKNGR